MMASGRHHVTRVAKWWKPYAVVRQEVIEGPKPGQPRGWPIRSSRPTPYYFRYTTVGRHWTFKAAKAEQQRRDRAAGFAQ